MLTTTIVASLLGLLGAALPRLLGWLEAKQKSKDLAAMQAHELKLFDLQTKRAATESAARLRELDAAYDGQANLAVYDFARPTTGWTARLSETVRPVVTYILLALFVLKTVALLFHLLGLSSAQGIGTVTGLSEAMKIIWDAETRDLFATVIVFWFGDRALNKRRG